MKVEPLKMALERAKRASEILRKTGIPHAIIGGMAVHTLIERAGGGVAHVRPNVDILMERCDFDNAAQALEDEQLSIVDLQCNRLRFDALRVVFAGEQFGKDARPAPQLGTAAKFLSDDGFDALRIEPLVAMKLSAFRAVDKVHIQDLLEQKLITRKIENALPSDLRERLREVMRDTERERL